MFAHTEVLPEILGVGRLLIVTTVVPALLLHPFCVMVNEYVPAFTAVTFVMLGFCWVEEKLFGPVQLYVVPDCVAVVRFSVAPVHNGPLLLAVGVEGFAFIVTMTVS